MAERHRLRVLLVDDDPDVARLVRRVLREHGFAEPTWVAAGREGLAEAERHDAVLLDHRLPDVSGLEVLRTLRARSSRPAVVVITGHGDEGVAALALRLGADDYLAKDASLAELLPQVLERVRRSLALGEALAAAERDLVRAERLAAIGEMSITLSHEINNPLASAYVNLEILLGEGLSGEQRSAAEGVKAALDRIRDILRRAGELRQARTAEYAPGIRMIDLARPDPPAPAYQGHALLFLPDEDIARVVSLLLRHAGFVVERSPGLQQLQEEARRPEVRLVVVTAADGPGGHPLGGFRPRPGRHYALVVLTGGDPGEARAAGADHAVTLPLDPGTFASELLGALTA